MGLFTGLLLHSCLQFVLIIEVTSVSEVPINREQLS